MTVATFSALNDRQPAYALVSGVDLVIVRYDDAVSVLYGRCLHRGALMSDGYVDGDDLICGVHRWACWACGPATPTTARWGRSRLVIEASAKQLENYLLATVQLMQVMARACGHDRLSGLCPDDLSTWKRDVAWLTGVSYAGVAPL